MGAPMTYETRGYEFVKESGSNMVNVYVNGVEKDVFTQYNIGEDTHAFEEACEDFLEYMEEAYI